MSTQVDLATLVGDLRDERPPLYLALATRIQAMVGDGRLPVGARLPAERELAGRLRLSRSTVAAAYARLREDGWVEARQGAGTWTRLPSSAAFDSWIIEPPMEGVIAMAHAAPSAPPQLAAAIHTATDEMPRFLRGHGYYPGGLGELRERIAGYYQAKGLPTTAEQIVVTSGALNGVTLALDVLGRRDARVLVEAPSYPNALDAIGRQGMSAVPVAVDAEDPAAVAVGMQRAARQTGATVAYVMPDFQNPTGLLLDDRERSRLSATFADLGVAAIVDETMADLAFGPTLPTPYAAFVGRAEVVTVGSMGKSFWGGMRLGWVRAEAGLARSVLEAASARSLAPPVFEQLVAGHLLDGADDVLDGRRARLRVQRDRLLAGLAERLPTWRARRPDGGLVLWCELPPGQSSTFLAGAAPAHGLHLVAGPRFGTGYAYDDRIRLPFTHPVDVLDEAVRRLAETAGLVAGPGQLEAEPDLVV